MELGINNFRKNNILSEDEAIKIANLEEDHYLDFKSIRIKPADIQKPAVAFSNADGGTFIIGVEDKKTGKTGLDRWSGATSLEELDTYLSVLRDISELKYDWWYYSIKNRPYEFYLGITITSGDQVVMTSKEECFCRNGASSLHIKDISKIRELAYAKGAQSYEDIEQVNFDIDQLEQSTELADYINNLKLRQNDPLDFLIQEKLINDKWVPNTVSVLLFSNNPCSLIPQAAIRISCYSTSGAEELRDDLTFNERYEGNIFYLIEHCTQLIMSKLNEMNVWTINGEEKLQFHEDAIFEIIVNCLAHRDYSLNDIIRIVIFNNRIIFKSPGKLPNGINFDNLLLTRRARNPKIMRYLSKATRPNSHNRYVQEMGEGLNTVASRLKEAKLQDPLFAYEENSFVVTLIHGSRESPDILIPKFVKKFGSINNRKVRDILGIESKDASTILSSLGRKNLIKYSATNKHWHAIEIQA